MGLRKTAKRFGNMKLTALDLVSISDFLVNNYGSIVIDLFDVLK